MKFNLLFSLILFSLQGIGQSRKPIILKALSDSFIYREVNQTTKIAINKDTMSFGTDLFSNVFTIKTEIDSFSFRYNLKMKPKAQGIEVNVISPSGIRKVVYLNFHAASSWFTPQYIEMVKGKVQYNIPETYELANVLYALTKSSELNTYRTLKSTPYYNKVMSYFSKYKNHPLIRHLEFPIDGKGSEQYFNFRDNSFCYTISGNSIVANNQYFKVNSDNSENLFKKYLLLINDFYKVSNFHKFYKMNQNYYDSLLKEERVFMPAKKMWMWLENNFPGRYQSYRVVFSPLINGSHETQIFSWISDKIEFFREAVMFVCSTERIKNSNHLNNNQREGIASGILFTEIDHNYCNPISYQYQKQIDSAFSNRNFWVKPTGDVELYPSAISIFNEYITHGIYLLYELGNLNKSDFEVVKKDRIDLMVNHRKYYRFEAFTNKLIDLYLKKSPNQTASSLYPYIIEWCKQQK